MMGLNIFLILNSGKKIYLKNNRFWTVSIEEQLELTNQISTTSEDYHFRNEMINNDKVIFPKKV